jgi:hypothetical protein
MLNHGFNTMVRGLERLLHYAVLVLASAFAVSGSHSIYGFKQNISYTI